MTSTGNAAVGTTRQTDVTPEGAPTTRVPPLTSALAEVTAATRADELAALAPAPTATLPAPPPDASPRVRTAVRAAVGLALVVVAGLALTTGDPQTAPAPPAPSAPVEPATGPAPVMPVSDVRTGMAAAATWNGTATYKVFTDDGATATVVLARSGDRSRVDVITADGASASLLRADAGWVACTTVGTTECLLVAARDAAVPPAFDSGVAALLTTTLPSLAGLQEGFAVTRELPVARALAPAQCASVDAAASPAGAGQYCLTNAGLLRRAWFAGGRMNLVEATTDRPADAVFAPPAVPVPLV